LTLLLLQGDQTRLTSLGHFQHLLSLLALGPQATDDNANDRADGAKRQEDEYVFD
jgi:hypothetical protein